MRDLEFRAWDGMEFSYLGFGKGQDIYSCGSFKTIEQYIGLKSKSGVKIFEGDKIKGGMWNREVLTVVYDKYLCGFIGKTKDGLNYFIGKETEWLEVVGNIHE